MQQYADSFTPYRCNKHQVIPNIRYAQLHCSPEQRLKAHVCILLNVFAAPVLSGWALSFNSPEYFLLAVAVIPSLGTGSALKALLENRWVAKTVAET